MKDTVKHELCNLTYVLSVTAWALLAFILPEHWEVQVNTWSAFFTLLFHLSVVSTVTFLLILTISSYKWLNAVLLPLLALAGSVLTYYRLAYHATLTPVTIDVTLHTNAQEAMGVMAWPLCVYTLLNLCIAGAFIYWRWKMAAWQRSWLHLLVGFVCLSCLYSLHPRLRDALGHRFPCMLYYQTKLYAELSHVRDLPRTMMPYACDTTRTDSLKVIVVLGESIRADHLSLNGYERPTMPRLSKIPHVLSIPHVHSAYTHTLASLPHLLTPNDQQHPDMVDTQESFISYYKQQGFYSAWISNQDDGYTYTHFVHSTDTTLLLNGQRGYVQTQWTDEELLTPTFQLLHAGRKQLFVLHTIGAHWYYNIHVPEHFRPFQPIASSKIITSNAPQSVINSYDNCVAYMDEVMACLIDRLKDEKAILFYQSDHGESLGENGEWLHATGAEETKYPASFVWYSDRYATAFPDRVKQLHLHADEHVETDYLCPTVLHAAGITLQPDTVPYNTQLSLMR